MSWKFKASKYKNTAPLDPKFDKQIRELAIGSYHSSGMNMIHIYDGNLEIGSLVWGKSIVLFDKIFDYMTLKYVL